MKWFERKLDIVFAFMHGVVVVALLAYHRIVAEVQALSAELHQKIEHILQMFPLPS